MVGLTFADSITISGVALSAGVAVMQMTSHVRLGRILLAIAFVSLGISGSLLAVDANAYHQTTRLFMGTLTGALAGLALSWMLLQTSAAQPQLPPDGKPVMQDKSTPAPNSTTTQTNQSGPNLNIPGTGNTINVFPTPLAAPTATSDIFQAGVVVGSAHGGRRLPTNATMFEFVEITNCAQFATNRPFTFEGVRLQFVSEQNSAMMVMGRPDSPIRFGVLARVLD